MIKGMIGEKSISLILNLLPSEKYTIVNDLLIRTSYGSTQIDHVVLSEYGIFIIETKNYKGWIYGGENSEQWTKNVYGHKYYFRNPLKQNYAHEKALKEILNITNPRAFVPIVVFSNAASIRVNSTRAVINSRKLLGYIKSFQTTVLDSELVGEYTSKLYSYTGYTKEERKEHVSFIKTEAYERDNKIQNNICPRCGGNLVPRNGKYGSFFGCSNYPKCRFTK
ncbi:MAG: NERD domain-containing protein [Treponema sp.]|uniref:NERD domain-containing protein n=1 Tax=Treponema sp. TaxID=166 RepID=UPI00298DF1B1|nr:NERD domain-containing protein [Treponema sp.]MCR5386644.1 NERD domain-containing protein [Treponema sp.]